MDRELMTFAIRGVAPLLMHNGQLANPLNKWAKAIKAITSKRKKTDEDHAEIARLEFLGGLYTGKDGTPVIPGVNIEGCFISGAKKQRLGEQFKAGLFCDDDFPLAYKGPKSPEKMWEAESFRDIRKASVGKASVMRCRPYFAEWSLTFTAAVDLELIDRKQVAQTLAIAGKYCGLCDFTPKFGRFEVVEGV